MSTKTENLVTSVKKKHHFKVLTQGLDKGRHVVYLTFRKVLLNLWPHLIRHKKLYPYLRQVRHAITEKDGVAPRYVKPAVKMITYVVLMILLGGLCLEIWKSWYSTFNSSHLPKKQNPVVVIAPVTQKDVPVYLTALGTVTPLKTITIKTQINGQFLKVHFKDGQMVKKGELLAEIDDRPYKAQLMQYEGQLQRDTALLTNAKLDLVRYRQLYKEDSITQQTLDTQIALVAQYEGDVKTDEGLIETAKLNIYYCRIISPEDGQIGIRLTDPGNYVQTTDTTGIAILNTVSPIEIAFTIPEDYAQSVLQPFKQGVKLVVEAYDRWQNKLLATGSLKSIDNQINTTTGTVKVEGLFNNENQSLFANQFVNVHLMIDTLKHAVVVPTVAIQYGPSFPFVYRLNKDDTVKIIPIKIAHTNGDETAITGEIKPGQIVITQGTDKLSDGIKIRILKSHKKGKILHKDHS